MKVKVNYLSGSLTFKGKGKIDNPCFIIAAVAIFRLNEKSQVIFSFIHIRITSNTVFYHQRSKIKVSRKVKKDASKR